MIRTAAYACLSWLQFSFGALHPATKPDLVARLIALDWMARSKRPDLPESFYLRPRGARFIERVTSRWTRQRELARTAAALVGRIPEAVL